MKKYRFYGLMMAFAWLFVTGSLHAATLLAGVLIGVPLAYLFRRFYPGEIHVHLYTIYYVLQYTSSFVGDLITSNVDVARKVLTPSMPVSPGMIEYTTSLHNPTAMTILANSITLTPGTLVVECRESDGKMLIHCLNSEDEEKTLDGIRKWESLLKKIFGEKR